MMSWAVEEFKDIDLGDRRLDKRTVLLAERMAANPLASIPQACGGWAETQAAYRFLAQDDIEWEAILAPHWQSAEVRMRAHRVVLCLQDTTELDFNGQRIAGLGPLSYEAQRGMYVHPTYAVSPEREPLGVLDAWMWAREPKDTQGKREGLLESTRWTEGYLRIAELAGRLPDTRLVYVADREADIVALMAQARDLGHPADWLIRSQHNRALPEGGKLWELSAHFLRLYRSLHALVGGDDALAQSWLKSANRAFDGERPVDCIKRVEGLLRACEYLDSQRAGV